MEQQLYVILAWDYSLHILNMHVEWKDNNRSKNKNSTHQQQIYTLDTFWSLWDLWRWYIITNIYVTDYNIVRFRISAKFCIFWPSPTHSSTSTLTPLLIVNVHKTAENCAKCIASESIQLLQLINQTVADIIQYLVYRLVNETVRPRPRPRPGSVWPRPRPRLRLTSCYKWDRDQNYKTETVWSIQLHITWK